MQDMEQFLQMRLIKIQLIEQLYSVLYNRKSELKIPIRAKVHQLTTVPTKYVIADPKRNHELNTNQ